MTIIPQTTTSAHQCAGCSTCGGSGQLSGGRTCHDDLLSLVL